MRVLSFWKPRVFASDFRVECKLRLLKEYKSVLVLTGPDEYVSEFYICN